MAKVVKLKQSDITKMVENIIKEQDMNVNDTDMGTQSIEKPGPDAHELTLGVDKDGNYYVIDNAKSNEPKVLIKTK